MWCWSQWNATLSQNPIITKMGSAFPTNRVCSWNNSKKKQFWMVLWVQCYPYQVPINCLNTNVMLLKWIVIFFSKGVKGLVSLICSKHCSYLIISLFPLQVLRTWSQYSMLFCWNILKYSLNDTYTEPDLNNQLYFSEITMCWMNHEMNLHS